MSEQNRREIEGLTQAIQKTKERIERLETLRKGLGQPFWLALKAEIDLSIKATEHQRDTVLERDGVDSVAEEHAQIKGYAYKLLAYKGVQADVEKSEDKIRFQQGKLTEYTERMKKARAANRGNPTKEEAHHG